MKTDYTDRPILNLNEDLLTPKTVYKHSKENIGVELWMSKN